MFQQRENMIDTWVVIDQDWNDNLTLKVGNHSPVLRYDLIDRPGVLENYVPLNYHCLYDLSVLVKGVSRVYTQGRNCPNVKHECYTILSIKSYLKNKDINVAIQHTWVTQWMHGGKDTILAMFVIC